MKLCLLLVVACLLAPPTAAADRIITIGESNTTWPNSWPIPPPFDESLKWPALLDASAILGLDVVNVGRPGTNASTDWHLGFLYEQRVPPEAPADWLVVWFGRDGHQGVTTQAYADALESFVIKATVRDGIDRVLLMGPGPTTRPGVAPLLPAFRDAAFGVCATYHAATCLDMLTVLDVSDLIVGDPVHFSVSAQGTIAEAVADVVAAPVPEPRGGLLVALPVLLWMARRRTDDGE